LNYVAVPVVCDFEAATIFFHDDTLRWPVPLERAYVRPASPTLVSVLSMDSVVLTRTLISAIQHNSCTQHRNAGQSSVTACAHTPHPQHSPVPVGPGEDSMSLHFAIGPFALEGVTVAKIDGR
jgi:hypothetical protein